MGSLHQAARTDSAAPFNVQLLTICTKQRSLAILWSIENLIIYVLGITYLALIYFCTPGYLDTVLPMAMATYSAYSRKTTGIFCLIIFAVMMGMTFADFRTRYASPLRAEVYYFLGICFAYFAYALANNGWAYTYKSAHQHGAAACRLGIV